MQAEPLGDAELARPTVAGGERGATVVEFALVGILLFTLIFGAFDYGIYFNNREDIRNGIREAGRAAIVQSSSAPLPTGTCTLTGAAAAATGSDKDLLCLIKSKVVGGNSNARVAISWPDGASAAGNHLEICAMYPTSGTIGLTVPFIPPRVTSVVTVRLEQPFPDHNAFQETSNTVAWSTFCT